MSPHSAWLGQLYCLTCLPPSDAELARKALMKLKLVSAVLLAACTLAVGAGLLALPTPNPQPVEERAEDKPPSVPVSVQPQVRRDQTGDPLPAEAISRLGTLRFRHSGMIQSLAFTPDGKTLLSAGAVGLRIWEAASGKQIRLVEKGSVGWETIDVSPDGKLVAVLLPEGEAYVGLMEIATGKIVRRFSKCRVNSLCFSRQWIADLDSEQFAAREKATAGLEQHAATALPAMRKTLAERPTLEMRRRLEQLIAKQEREEWSPSG